MHAAWTGFSRIHPAAPGETAVFHIVNNPRRRGLHGKKTGQRR
jgi:hypothetical protein